MRRALFRKPRTELLPFGFLRLLPRTCVRPRPAPRRSLKFPGFEVCRVEISRLAVSSLQFPACSFQACSFPVLLRTPSGRTCAAFQTRRRVEGIGPVCPPFRHPQVHWLSHIRFEVSASTVFATHTQSRFPNYFVCHTYAFCEFFFSPCTPPSPPRLCHSGLCYTQALRASPEVPLFPALCPKSPAIQATV